MGQIYSSYNNCNYIQLQEKIENKNQVVLLTTLSTNDYLIKGTIHVNLECDFVNNLAKKDKSKEIVVYGKDHLDMRVIKKYNELKKIGFVNVSIYFGGLFEWALLQETYGKSNFQTDGNVDDLMSITQYS